MKKQLKYDKNILLDAADLGTVTNIGVETLMYIQMFILVKAAFILEGIQPSSLIIKKRTNKVRRVFWYN